MPHLFRWVANSSVAPVVIAAAVWCGMAAAQAPAPAPAPAAADEFRVTLLGTGSPAPVMRRFGPGVLIQAGGKHLLIDNGRGITQRLMQPRKSNGDTPPASLYGDIRRGENDGGENEAT